MMKVAATIDPRVEENPDSALSDIVDLARYPLHDPESGVLRSVINKVREDLEKDGCARIPAFIESAAHSALTDETNRLADKAYFITNEFTPYGTGAKDGFPDDHPQRRLQTSSNGFVAGDMIGEETMLKRLYRNNSFKEFISRCLGKDEIHHFADPMRNCVVNVMKDDTTLAWHFDANEFIVSLMTRAPQGGGAFEYCPNIRSKGSENYDRVQNVLDGKSGEVKQLFLSIGDLQLFTGRYSLHRVGHTQGDRHTVLFGFSEQPGYIGALESTRLGYGRVTQMHIDAEKRRHDDGLAG
ncbi:hypothetical protein EOI86_04310 [Hwanghaeella grinnelliae]|uniref:Fe2OG dioxygenase domain-containing protein n=1 Tax=Hwanghaeella grinnelliae TaxID=2500179 RepID=A0A437QVG3_9PROT|nr:hypothetical protein [Hwanghaeella grinnelliae]RVU38514.1 hypothetical protein EOI86_04310 [Hwanghaeella grinnelliae]